MNTPLHFALLLCTPWLQNAGDLTQGSKSLASCFRYLGKMSGPHKPAVKGYTKDFKLVLQRQIVATEKQVGREWMPFPGQYHSFAFFTKWPVFRKKPGPMRM